MGGGSVQEVVVSNPSPDSGWSFLTLYCCKNCVVCLKWPKINEIEAEDGPFKKQQNRICSFFFFFFLILASQVLKASSENYFDLNTIKRFFKNWGSNKKAWKRFLLCWDMSFGDIFYHADCNFLKEIFPNDHFLPTTNDNILSV